MEIESLTFTAYIEPQPATVAWYRDVLVQLARYGLSYHRNMERVLTWNEVVQTSPDELTLGANYESYHGTISQWLEQLPAAVHSSIATYDRGTRIKVAIQPHARYESHTSNPMRVLGKVTLHYDASYFHTDGPSDDQPVPRYMQTWQAHLHWSEICCRILHPIYA